MAAMVILPVVTVVVKHGLFRVMVKSKSVVTLL
jgi:hypothetical protein